MNTFAQGSRLAGVRPADTNNADLFEAVIDTEITRLLVCNTANAARTFRLFMVPDGESAGLDYALYYDKQVAANDTFEVVSDTTGAGIQLKEGDTLVVRSSSADEVTFTAFGVTLNTAPVMG